MTKIYFSNKKITEKEKNKSLLGGKGYHLFEMSQLDLPVPDFCVIPTSLFKEYYENKNATIKKIKDELIPDIIKYIGKEALVSVRSGAPVSMPGMMDTILNLGINKDNVDDFAKKYGKDFALDCLKRYFMMYGEIALGINKNQFEQCLNMKFKNSKDLISHFDQIYKKNKFELPGSDIDEQLFNAIISIIKSWDNERAVLYRDMNNISHDMGTAIVIQKMVFGNKNENSATGVLFSRNPNTGSQRMLGEYLVNAQGEDVVAGVVTPLDLEEMRDWNTSLYNELRAISKKLEEHFKDVQDIEFTIEEGNLYLLQTRKAKRTPYASLKFAVDFYKEEKITAKEVFERVEKREYLALNTKQIDEGFREAPDAIGLSASAGITVGRVVFDYDGLHRYDENKILIAKETTPDDLPTLKEVQGIITLIGGVTSHAAVVARGLNKNCIVGCDGIKITAERKATVGGKEIKEGDWITMDSATGRIWVSNKVPIIDMEANPIMLKFEDLVFEAFSLVRATSSINDLIKGNETIFSSYSLDERFGDDLENDLRDITEFLTGTLDMTGKIDYMIETGKRVHPFAEEMASKVIKNKIEALLSIDVDREFKQDFEIYLGKYHDEYVELLKDHGFKVTDKTALNFSFLNKKDAKGINVIKDIKYMDKFNKPAISSKNALMGILR